MSDGNDNTSPRPEGIDMDELARQMIDRFGGAQAALEHFGVLGEGPPPFVMPPRPMPVLLKRRRAKATYVVRVDLDHAKPPIWRRLRLASDMSLARLHDVLQIAMGWTDSHLHHFQLGPDEKNFQMMPFRTDFDEIEGETEGPHERDVRLDQTLATPGQRLFYEYDFGDSWAHTIKLEKVEPWSEDAPDAVCVTGRRACPPEDVGGTPGYEDAIAIWRGEPGENPEWTQQIRDWLPDDFDPERFDADEVNDELRRGPVDLTHWHPLLAGILARSGGVLSPLGTLISSATDEPAELTDAELREATKRYRHLLRVIGDGVKLTQAGYLPPALVKQVFDELSLGAPDWPFPVSREDATLPVWSLRESAIDLGLLRKQHGRLLPTAAAKRLVDDPSGLFRHIRGRLPLGRADGERDAGLLDLLYTASGESLSDQREAAAHMFELLGWRSDESDLGRVLVWAAEATHAVLVHLCPEGRNRQRVASALLQRPSSH